ncbi:MAG: glycosyltransferase family 4 protein [Halobacteria archaeon]
MRVLLVCRSALGGGSIQAQHLLRGLASRGHSPVMVSQREAGRAFSGSTVYRLPLPSTAGEFRPLPWLASGVLLGVGAAAAALRHRTPVLHAMEVAASGLAGLLAGKTTPAVRLLRFGGFLPSEVASHLRPPGWSPGEPMERTLALPHPSVRMAAALQKLYLDGYDFLLPTTEHAAGLLRGLGIPRERIRVVPNGVDAKAFAPRKVPRLFDGPTLLAGGRFEPWKGLHLLLEAAARIGPEFPGLRVLLVGEGPEEPRLRALARDLGLGDRVVFRPAVPHRDLPALFNGADAVAVPVYANVGVSNILQEAMACGRPVVASSIPGVAEFLEPGRSGLRFPPGDVEGLAEGLRTLLGDPGLRERLGAEARRLVAERFSVEAVVERTLSVYREAAARFGERRR